MIVNQITPSMLVPLKTFHNRLPRAVGTQKDVLEAVKKIISQCRKKELEKVRIIGSQSN